MITYPPDMPPEDRERVDAIDDPELRRLTIELWQAAQDRERRLDAGDLRTRAEEQRLEKRKAIDEALRQKGLFEKAKSGALGPDAQAIAEQCESQLVAGATRAALYREFDRAWRAERTGR